MKRKKVGIYLIFIIIAAYLFFNVIEKYVNFEPIKYLIVSTGIKGKMIFSLIVFVTTVFAPISSFPLWPIALYAYGLWGAAFLTFIGSFTGGVVNFYIARFLGRLVVIKFVGKNAIKNIDRFTNISGIKTLLILRILAANYFDYVSYASGLTSMKFRFFFLVSFPTSLVPDFRKNFILPLN